MFSYFSLIYAVPDFETLGYRHPDKYGQVNCSLKGRVRTVSSFHYIIENGKKYCSNKCYYVVYDERRQLRQLEAFDKDGSLIHCVNFFYNESKRCDEVFILNPKGGVSHHDKFYYNKEGLLYIIELYDEEGYMGQHVYIYDERGFVVEERWDSRSPSNRWKRLYENNDHGDWVEMKEYVGQFGTFEYRYSRKNIKNFDEHNNLIGHILVSDRGFEQPLTFDEYDEKGRCIKMTNYKLKFLYDTYDRFIEARNPDDELAIKVLYNADNSIIILSYNTETHQIEKKRNVFFDNHGNVSKILYYEGENLDLIEVASYQYEYYPE